MGIFKQKYGKKERFVISRYWPDGSRYRHWMPNMAVAKVLLARIDNSIAIGSWEDLRNELEGKKPKEETIGSFTPKFIDIRCKPRMRTWDDYDRSLRYVCEVYGDVPIKELRQSHAVQYMELRSAKVAQASVNREIAALRALLSYAVVCELIQFNPLQRMKLLPEQEKANYALTPEEVARLIESQMDTLHEAMIGVLSETGIRIQEAVDLRWEAIDFQRKILSVARSKNYKAREIPLSPVAIGYLQSLLRYIGNPWVFANGPKTRLTYPRKSFLTSVEAAGLQNIGFHDLRRYRATQWHKNGLEVRAVCALLGHSDTKTTQRYLGIERDLVDRVKEVQEREQKALFSAPVGKKQVN